MMMGYGLMITINGSYHRSLSAFLWRTWRCRGENSKACRIKHSDGVCLASQERLFKIQKNQLRSRHCHHSNNAPMKTNVFNLTVVDGPLPSWLLAWLLPWQALPRNQEALTRVITSPILPQFISHQHSSSTFYQLHYLTQHFLSHIAFLSP
jgi:hypothetical protein